MESSFQSADSQEPDMTLATSLEWSILQSIGASTVAKWSRHRRIRPTGFVRKARQNMDNNLIFLEIDLRQLLLVKLASKTLPLPTFKDLQDGLRRLCLHLEQFVNQSFIKSDTIDPLANAEVITSSAQRPLPGDDAVPAASVSVVGDYCNLRVLCKRLRDTAGESARSETQDVNLIASRPDQKAVFIVSSRLEAKEMLEITKSCHAILRTLFQNQGSGFIRPAFAPKFPFATTFGERAITVLEVLLSQYALCESAHEVLLSLSDKLDAVGRSSRRPILEILLSDCLRGNQHHEAQCVPYDGESHDEDYQLDEIANLCEELRERHQENTTIFFYRDEKLFKGEDRREVHPISDFDATSFQSLHDLVKAEAFLPPPNTLDDGTRRPDLTIGPKQKNALALKMAHCLNQFLLRTKPIRPNWDSKRILLKHPPGSEENYFSPVYMPFTRLSEGLQTTAQSIYAGEPNLLAFSKLLLEIKMGKEIDLSQYEGPTAKWAQLCVHAHQLDAEGGGLYAEAINCALFLSDRGRPQAGEDPTFALQRAMRDGILSQLAMATNPPSALGTKRRRSGSDSRTDYDSGIEVRPFQEPKSPTNLTKRPRTMNSQNMNGASRPTTQHSHKRVSIFRAREVTLLPREIVTHVVEDIVKANLGGPLEHPFSFEVRAAPTMSPGATQYSTVRRGAALVYFHGDVPGEFKSKTTTKICRMTNGQDGEHKRSMEVDAHFLGPTPLYEPAPGVPIKADIIAIHGLNGHPCGSWLSKTENPTMWLHEYLPLDTPRCRILLYGYKSNFFQDADHDRHDVATQSVKLAATLADMRSLEAEKRPIIFIAHSYGGLVLARTLIDLQAKRSPIHAATVAIMFMACPMRSFHTKDLLHALHPDDPDLKRPRSDKAATLIRRLGNGEFFRSELANLYPAVEGMEIFSFYEQEKTKELTNKSGKYQRDGEEVMAAGPNSVLLDWPNETAIPVDKDHSEIVKIEMQSDDTYQHIVSRIRKMLGEC
ncbi:hypothetical protein B0T25DRAFT_528662 [Lasiosphaeria hispida]|uniref:AB hydrolase-1 domain-containing protein n=1 Tax=Lasiosphaeria hispida TaxID=260671 RepID=A0AAJ0MKS6_9PEZI|nr:hypothetical protein B0T25DRAFT_528662 [Lasiosphaeria hispida]